MLIALALLCSGKDLKVLERFIKGKYKTNKVILDVHRHSKKLGLIDDGVKGLRDAQEFYHKYSHPSKMTIASLTSFSEEGLYVGASFDDAKIEVYTKEVDGRLGLAKVLVSFVEAVKVNVGKW